MTKFLSPESADPVSAQTPIDSPAPPSFPRPYGYTQPPGVPLVTLDSRAQTSARTQAGSDRDWASRRRWWPQPPVPGRCADSPPLASPGCAEATWLAAGAPKPGSFSMPAISLSCWAKKAAAGSSSAASGAPLSDDEKKPKSSAIFPAWLLSPPARARGPHFPSPARLACHCGCSGGGRSRGGNVVTSAAEGGARGAGWSPRLRFEPPQPTSSSRESKPRRAGTGSIQRKVSSRADFMSCVIRASSSCVGGGS